MSVGNQFIEIPLDKNSTTLIVGKNGAGKSLMLDAITFALFGKSYRKIKKTQLVNSVNDRECLTEIEFTIGTNEYFIRRGMKPNIFEIYKNDSLISQDSSVKDYQKRLEEQILKMNYKSFCQVVILGSSTYVPFMQLTPADRRMVVEELLDIQIFSTMNVVLKQRYQTIKEDILQVNSQAETLRKNIELQESYIEDIKKNNEKALKEKKEDLRKAEENLNKVENALERIDKAIERQSKKLSNSNKVDEKLLKLSRKNTDLKRNIKVKKQEITFFENNDVCPTCSQDLTKEHVSEKIEELSERLLKLKNSNSKIEDKILELKELQKKIEEISSKINEYINMKNDFKTEKKVEQSKKENLEKEIEKIKSNKKKSSKKYEAKLEELLKDYSEKEKEKKEVHEKKEYYDFVQSILKDSGIKTKIVSQYLPIMNNLINKYLNALNLGVTFELDEGFNEIIKSRHMDEFSYNSFSEGEKQRIDIAILFAWREIARLKNSVNTSLIIFDEIFDSSLDGAGTEDFLKVLLEVTQNCNALIISHNGDTLYDKFDACLEYEKPGNFTKIKSFDEERF